MPYYLGYGPADTRDDVLIRVAGTRPAVEEYFQAAKGQVGLDEYQVRHYDAWYRRITLAMWTHAFLATTAHLANAAPAPIETASSPPLGKDRRLLAL
jgi:SRSO17 transposase